MRMETGSAGDGKKNWQHLKEKLRLRRSGSGRGSAWKSSVHTPASDVPINSRQGSNRNLMIARRPSGRYGPEPGAGASSDISAVPDVDMDLMSNRGFRAASLQRNVSHAVDRNMSRGIERNISRASGRFEHTNSLSMRRSRGLEDVDHDNEFDLTPNSAKDEEGEEEEGETENEEDEVGGDEKKPRVTMSLMALLAETEGSAYTMEEDEDDDDDDEDDESSCQGAGYSNCCICLVRHKGSGFIQCGHTFCRLCSRELCSQKGHCPLCNNYILEILDIF